MSLTTPDNDHTLSFSSLTLQEALLTNLASLDYQHMTPIQAKSLPLMLNGADVIAQAKTGSGKTAAFGLALLNHLNVTLFDVQALILCPTRELAEQVGQVLRRIARQLPNIKILNLSGGLPLKPQLNSLKHRPHIIVGTPGRVQKHLDQGSLTLTHLQTLVLDEADKMLDMGFFDAIKHVVSFCPTSRQTLLFSATYPPQIKQLAHAFMKNPQHVVIEDAKNNVDIEQCFYEVTHQSNKFAVLKALLHHHQPTSVLLFCNTKEQSMQIAKDLSTCGFSAIALNGDMEQAARDQAIICFINQSISILVATDVAARGLDIEALPMIINYDIAFDHDVHIHRIGRTGRSGCKGVALSITLPSDGLRLCAIEDELQKPLTWGDINALNKSPKNITPPPMVTLCLSVGKKDKIRAGDILGALTKEAGLPGESIGKMNISSIYSYIAIQREHMGKAIQYLKHAKLKGRTVKVKRI